ncbi:MAG TPA: DHA2 family efflux MFS transporter permease subunit [Chitinophagales bacterium]|jgi:DHA2 family multidrug resistance protein|nr:DHA2 family efflux MFS transporter permease subunit [Chitinophagales bacterium]MBP6154713.1 DHA2 family efflux MFS transporter permease subunit [Chitinophagales bacterium]HQV78498.1 DHA2 family efflux MFS transporter permease subunit [Chitinophagales bacterium]HQW78816.1 DHA2 family efflux MFS transporter permease subunit [Chitinophagales bacterium]HRB19771.1 DHA2 family efflux MFS transporter permease subunit [Chitinophagales bacterium]
MTQEQTNSLIEYGSRRVIITITVVLCTLLELIDTTVVNVATTTLMGNLGATLSEVSWVVASYAIANVIIVPMSGWLSATFGRKYYFAGSVTIFTFGSLMCGLSNSIWVLVFWRFVQGIGGGALFATSQTILKEIYPPEKIGMAMAMFGMGVIVGPTIGPYLGGYLVYNFSWPIIFYINIPIGILATFLTLTYIRDNPYEKKSGSSVDWFGIILLIIGIGSLQLVLEQGERKDWFESQFIIVFTFLSIVGILGFIYRMLTTEHPIVDLRVLKKGNVAIGTVMNFILGFILYGSVFIYPIYMQHFLGFTAQLSGEMFIPGALLSGLMMPIIGGMLSKGTPPKFMIISGFLITAIFVYWSSFIFTTNTGTDAMFWPLLVRGFGMAFLFVPLSALILGGLKGADVGQASGISNMVRQIGGSMSVAIIGVLNETLSAEHRANLLNHITPDNPILLERLNGMKMGLMSMTSDANHAAQQALAFLNFTIDKQAAILSYIDIFHYFTIFILVTVPLVLFAKTYKFNKDDMDGAH